MEMKEEPSQKKRLGGTSFLVTIRQTENMNMQGVIHWLDTNQKVTFRSTLELLNLMIEATGCVLSKTDSRKWEATQHSKQA